jgi:hypothetical protein
VQSDKTLRKWYRHFNKRFFDNELPDNIGVRWAGDTEADKRDEERYFGWVDTGDVRRRWVIVLARECREDAGRRFSTLAHEMIHVATDCRDDHGPAFSRWHEHITVKGFFRKNAVVKGITMF